MPHIRGTLPSIASRLLPTRRANLSPVMRRLRRSRKPMQRSLLSQLKKKRKKSKRSPRLLRRKATASHLQNQSESLLHQNQARGARRAISRLRLQPRRHPNPLLRRRRTRGARKLKRNQHRHLHLRRQTRRRRPGKQLEEGSEVVFHTVQPDSLVQKVSFSSTIMSG